MAKIFPKYPPALLMRPAYWVTKTLIDNDIDPGDQKSCMVQLAWMLEQYNKADKK